MESEIAKWRATAHTVWRVECPKVANTTIAFVEVVRLNCQLSSKVGGVLAKLLCTRLDCDELFRCYKDLQVEKKELVGKVEGIAWAFGGMIFILVYCTAGISGSFSSYFPPFASTKSIFLSFVMFAACFASSHLFSPFSHSPVLDV